MNTSMKDTLSKAMGTMFAQIDNVKYDLATGLTGIVTDGGLVTLGADDTLDQNPMDFFSLALPAFAMLTPAKDIRRGDIIVSNGKAYAFVLESGLKPTDAPHVPRKRRTKEEIKADEEAVARGEVPPSEIAYVKLQEESEKLTKGELSTINVQGHVSRFRPRKVQMMGISDGLNVVRSFGSLFGSTSDQTSAGTNPMAQMLPLLMLSKLGGTNGKNTDLSSMLPMMMMMGGMGGAGSGLMGNPLMMMALLGDGGLDSLFKG